MKRGFTLVEVIVYILILAGGLVLVIDIFLGLARVFSVSLVRRELLLAGETALERLVRETRGAAGVNLPGSNLTADPATVDLGAIVFRVENEELVAVDSSGARQILVALPVRVESFKVSRVATGTVEALRYELSLVDQRGHYEQSEKFRGGAVLRQGYAGY